MIRGEIYRNRIRLRIGLLFFFSELVLLCLHAETESISPASLPVLLQRGVQAFSTGNFPQAVQIFNYIEEDYKTEQIWSQLQKKILPLKGYAELKAGLPQEAVVSLRTFLQEFPNETKKRSDVLYSLGLAFQRSGKPEKALARLEEFEIENPGISKAQFSKIQRAEIFFTLDRHSEGLDLLKSISGSSAPESLRNQARLRALQQTIFLERTEEAAVLLLEEPWSTNRMPEIAVLSFSAIELGDHFLTERNYAEAIRCFHLVLPQSTLVETQAQRLKQLKETYAVRAPLAHSSGKGFWLDYYKNLISRVESQLRGLSEAEDYTPSLRLRQAQAYLLNKRYHEAWLLCEHLATSPRLTTNQTEEAHYRWIFAASGLEEWEDALSIAKNFLARYPTSPRAPEAFYLISQAHLEQRRYPQAIEVFDEIIEHFPNHPMSEKALFTRGFAHTLLEDFLEARTDFTHYTDVFPQGSFNVNARLWHALTYFFEHQYDQALEELSLLSKEQKRHSLYPEILYRKGATLYAMRQHGLAQKVIEEFTTNYSLHPRFSEALILLGDIRMGRAQLDEALKAYSEIPPENYALFIYATFQTGKILKAQENYTSLVSHFIDYIEEKSEPAPTRISEALYWIGWAYIQLEKPEEAFPHFQGILNRYGNNPESTEIESTLSALHKIFSQQNDAPSFDTWLETHRQSALDQNQLTYFSRLTLFLYNRRTQQKHPETDALLKQIITSVPLENMDPLVLGKIGQWVNKQNPVEACLFFDMLVTRFPQSPHRAMGFYGLAQFLYKKEAPEKALRWLEKFNRETPGHPLGTKAALLIGKSLLKNEQATDATIQFEKVLRLKSGRGRVHAEALKGLAEAALQQGEEAKAIAYYQRIYTLYKAYTDLVSEAYFKSGILFENLGNLEASKKTFDEMLANPRLENTPQKKEAIEARKRIVSQLSEIPEIST
ncbi:MAG: tetratricopeptide repeat protein [Opitutaceae bacterium]|nr:tetratricopeptide repeat protein [Opitutaceae bacterium]